MAGTLKRIAGPAFLSNSAANIYTPPAATIWSELQHLHFANKSSGTVTFTIYVGGTGGAVSGTELFPTFTLSAAGTPGSVYDYYCRQRMDSTDFLTGLASSASAVVIVVEGEQNVV